MIDLDLIEKKLEKEKPYRLKQVRKLVFQDLIENWDEATVLPSALREEMNQDCPLDIEAKILKEKDTAKALIELKDGLKIESVLMEHEDDRSTVCVSSQVGCPLNCSFCATGKMGLKRNLEPFEMAIQVLLFSRYLKKKNKKVTNVVFMGMGEPFLNYDNVMSAIRILNSNEYFNIGSRKISVSTSGIIEGIERFSEEDLQVNLCISLHAPSDSLRSEIMPVNKKYPLKKVLEAVDGYILKSNRKVMFEYLMIKGVNDSLDCAKELQF